MKKTIIASAMSVLAALAASAATEFAGGEDYNNRTVIDINDNTADIILKKGYFKAMDSTLVRSVSGADTGTYSVAFGNFTVDASSVSDFTAWDLAGTYQTNYSSLTFKNTASSTANIAIKNAGNFDITATNAQSQSLNFLAITANVSAAAYNFNSVNGGMSTLNVSRTANVSMTGKMNFTNNSVLDVEGNLTANSAINMSGNSAMKVSGTYTQAAGTATLNNLTLTGKYIQTTRTDAGTNIYGKSKISAGATLEADGKLYLRSGSTFTVDGGSVITRYNSKGSRVLLENATLVINDGNALKCEWGTNNKVIRNAALVTINSGSAARFENNLYINATTSLDKIFVNGALMNVYMDDSAVLTITNEGYGGYITFDDAGKGEMKIYNFREDSIFLANNSTAIMGIGAKISLYDKAGEFLGIAKIGAKGALTAVPEPSAYAAILGAIAIAFALKRKAAALTAKRGR